MMTEQIIADKLGKLFTLVLDLRQQTQDAVERGVPLHKIEKKVLTQVLGIGKEIIGQVFERLGVGDVGEQCEVSGGRVLKRSAEPKTRQYQSVFGLFEFERYVYFQRAGQQAEFIPVDTQLALPECKFSLFLQDICQHLAMESSFDQAAKTVERILGVRQHVDSLERTNHKMAVHVESFQAQQKPPPESEEGAILVETADGKGVPIRRAADAPPIDEHQSRSGPKPDRKKMATVASVYSIDRCPRTAEEVVKSLFRKPDKRAAKRKPSKARPRPCHKRVRACLNHDDADGESINGRTVMFGWMADEVKARNPKGEKPLVCIMDGEAALWNAIDMFQAGDQRVEILDLLHVTSRLWKAANLFCGQQKAARRFVRQRVTSLLKGGLDGVIRGLRRMATLQLRGKARSAVETICRYFETNRHRMRYDHYLAEGYPIASGVIEGACRHVVKDRMERTGMNWTIPGAQAMLDLRSIHTSELWDQYQEFHCAAEIKRLHPYRHLIPQSEWITAA